MIISDVLTCTVPPLRVESSLLKKPYSSKRACAKTLWPGAMRKLQLEVPRSIYAATTRYFSQ